MPVDTKRIRGPEVSQSPLLFLPPVSQITEVSSSRQGSRGNGDVRPLFARCGLVSQAKGSAYLEAGNTKVICSVYGPRETERKDETDMKSGRLVCDFRLAPFSCPKRGAWIQSAEERDLSTGLAESMQPGVCLHRYPRAQIDVNVVVLENDGSVLAHAVTCASMALADAGIEMYDTVLGCALRQDGDRCLVDPDLAEEQGSVRESYGENQGRVAVALLPNLNQISGLQADGEMRADTLTAAVRMCVEGCHKLYPVVQQAILRAVKRKAPPPPEK
ncbi:exosome complex component MTR3 [Hemibagrus wyckioides]|uniref:exosome complex component MTR3 n=1 Tax=Hemibagrus wyckioides TaxID=337641 RepID=UPI00266BD626|nr:exosome complex component MTR3 [Hemibagrus wyckioides]